MRNDTFTITLPRDLITRLGEAAEAANTTPGLHAAALLQHAVTRPNWSDITENSALAAEVARLEGELDRARGLAVLLEAENAQLARIFEETVPELQAAVLDLKRAVAALPTPPVLRGGDDA